MIQSFILVLALVSIVTTNAVYDPKFTDLGLEKTGKPTYGFITILTGLSYPKGLHFNAPYQNFATLKQCADWILKNEHKGMASWSRKTLRCTLIWSDKTVKGDANRGHSRIVIRTKVLGEDTKVHETNSLIEYVPEGQTSWTATQDEVKDFTVFMDKCHVAVESWVTVHNVPQTGWSCLNYFKDDSSVLLFNTGKK